LVAQQVLEKVNGNIDSCVFSYIPNTAEVSFYGMIKEIERVHDAQKAEQLHALGAKATLDDIKSILTAKTRIEKIAIKDAKLRTFITQDDARDDLVAHVYDVTYGAIVSEQDNLVIIDDSIVRGTTLKQSILRMLDRLEPKNIIVVSSAPQIRYPDCYGIDMAKMSEFVAFEAAISLLKERGMNDLIEEVYESCKSQEALPKDEVTNAVKRIYEPFTDEEVSDRIALLLRPENIKANVQLVFQKIENVHKACPGHLGDWYFTGDYPTPGGNVVVNRSFINWMENRNERAY
jgi:amidophosphoribosyltransferase